MKNTNVKNHARGNLLVTWDDFSYAIIIPLTNQKYQGQLGLF